MLSVLKISLLLSLGIHPATQHLEDWVSLFWVNFLEKTTLSLTGATMEEQSSTEHLEPTPLKPKLEKKMPFQEFHLACTPGLIAPRA